MRQSLFSNKVAGLKLKKRLKRLKETLAQVFSCEFCKISKKTFFTKQQHQQLLLQKLCRITEEYTCLYLEFYNTSWLKAGTGASPRQCVWGGGGKYSDFGESATKTK